MIEIHYLKGFFILFYFLFIDNDIVFVIMTLTIPKKYSNCKPMFVLCNGQCPLFGNLEFCQNTIKTMILLKPSFFK